VNHDERGRGCKADNRLRGRANGARVFEQLATEFEDRGQFKPSVSSKPNATLKF
jgi:hypothetical protein